VLQSPRDYKVANVRNVDERNRVVFKRVAQSVVFFISTGSAVASFTTFGVTWVTIGIAGTILVLFLSLSANALLIYDSRKRRKGPKQIAFLTPSSGGQPFYATMLVGLAKNAARALGQHYIVVPSMPAESFETLSIWALFAGLEDRQLDIDGIIFIPDQPDRHFEELVGFHEGRGDIPLVLVDVYFDLDHCDERTRGRLPSFVGGDEMAGGAVAASIIIESIEATAGESPVVLIINGGVAPWEQQRAKAVRECLRARWPLVRFIETQAINYERSVAYDTTLRLVKSMADPSREVSLDAVFACNDDMAIGARGAISKSLRERYTFRRRPQIVGYDGIPEICEYIQEGGPYIAGTVDVRIEEQARTAMILMHKLVRTRQRRSEVQLITPEAVRRSHAPSPDV
jgi:ABC-type sugar transport system substrate-binding protein